MNGETLSLAVAAIRSITPDVKEFTLRNANGVTLPAFAAGAHLRFTLEADGVRHERCYSLLDAGNRSNLYRIAVQRAPRSRGGSAFLCEQVTVGSVLACAAPRNDFPLSPDARHHVLVAGGIGITPILAMAKALQAAGKSYELHYAARTEQAMPYRDYIASQLGVRARLYFDHGEPARGMPLRDVIGAAENGRHLYVCGPQAMIDAALALALDHGWARAAVHFELFANASRDDDRPLELQLARSRRTVRVAPTESLLDALLRDGLDLLYDCRRGECGVCAVDVLDGIPDHRDYALSDAQKAANGTICLCVSRARTGTLKLDL
ncbi:PDR/VanB family oxidoreductase [Cupriavidus alkaliphilus]|uniref:PDR/VanB family oxidoreductase n=1 Tax=Cupriavidus alkaliphilus TaxID=942866 RepID=UPI001620004E|nr:PDR/VanB family oxidoreductase [Cupriavidus alkaliphilus]MBB3016162.1 vanillate O-demethylase ferredoxin subunit [Cupriavidus alkaliphilus]